MEVIKKYGGRLGVLAIVGLAVFSYYQYKGLRSKVAEVQNSRNRMEAILNERYYEDTRQLEEAVRQDPSPENISRWRERTKLRQQQEQWMYETTSQAGAGAPFSRPLDTPAPNIEQLDDHTWRITVPGNLEVHTGIHLQAGQRVKFSNRSGQVKLNPAETYTNPPQGGYPTNKLATPRPVTWTLPEAFSGALIAKVGENGDWFDAGGRTGDAFNVTEGGGELILSVNCISGELVYASGQYQVVVTVQ